MSVEQTDDERDMLIADDYESTKARRIKNLALKSSALLQQQHDQRPTRSGSIASWLSSILASSHQVLQLRNTNSGPGKMSKWIHHDEAARRTRRQHNGSRPAQPEADDSAESATYDILDCDASNDTNGTPGYYLGQGDGDGDDDGDGFELGGTIKGRESPNYPFYNFYRRTLSSRNKCSNQTCCRIVSLYGCLLILLGLAIVLLIRLIALIQEQRPANQMARNGGRAWTESHLYELETGRATRWLVSNSKCHIPAIDPWHESIRTYVRRKPSMNCKEIFHKNANKLKLIKSHPLTFTKDNRLYFTDSAVRLGYLLNERCCYMPIHRSYDNDNDLIYEDKCYPLIMNGQIIEYSLVKIVCRRQNVSISAPPNATNGVGQPEVEPIYTNVHSFIVRDTDEEAALDRVSGKRLNQDDYYNVVLVGIDTISRLNAYRQLEHTLERLRKDYDMLEFVGYNKVGENTFPNLVPFLTGLRPEQLTEIQCWLASNYSQATETGDDYMDNCKYLWNYYQDLGYITYFSEDWPKASTFNYLKQGFRREPTTFYGRPFTVARDGLLLPPVDMGCSSCLLDRPLVQVDLDNLQNFIKINRHRPHFAFHWVNCPQHDDLNGASMVDSIFEQFFSQLKSIMHDDRTFVIFFSDHGYRWNDFVSTRVGHYESSLPLLTISPPKRFIRRHPDLYNNLKRHQSVLLTPFDLFKTLVAIRDLAKRPEAFAASDGQQPQINSSFLLPLANYSNFQQQQPATTKNPLIFEDPQYTSGPTAATTIRQLEMLDGTSYVQPFKTVSLLDANNSTQLDRSCIMAGIPDNYCVCHEFEETPATGKDVLGAAYYLVYVHLYARLKDHTSQCYMLDLKQVHKAELFNFKQMKSNRMQSRRRRRRDVATISTQKLKDITNKITTTTPSPSRANESMEEEVINEQLYLPIREYNIRLSTKPGGGLFQEVVRYYGDDSMKACEDAVDVAKSTIGDLADGKDFAKKHQSVIRMNEACRFSIHSDSISRLNLYKDQSKCIKSNVELKKICYCLNLPS